MARQDDEQPKKRGVSVAELFPNIRAELPSGATVTFRYRSGVDDQALADILKRDMPARAFTATVLHHQLIDPKVSQEAVGGWSDADLAQAARRFAEADPSGFGISLPDAADVFDAFRETARAYLAQIGAAYRETLNQFTSTYRDQLRFQDDIARSVLSHLNLISTVSPAEIAGRAALRVAQESVRSQLGRDLSSEWISAVNTVSAVNLGGFTPTIRELIGEYARTAAGAVNTLNQDFYRSLAGLTQPVSLQALLPRLPDLTEPLGRFAQAREGAQALDDAGFGYSTELWELQFLIELADLDRQDRPAAVLSELQSVTESQDMEDELRNLFADPTLRKRWPAVREGIEDHRRGRYYASVSVLLPQVEGIVNDTLEMLEVVTRDGSRFYRKNDDGSRGSELKGLEDKGGLARQKANIDRSLTRVLTGRLAKERNAVLHGSEPHFGKSELSIHLMLVLLSLALSVARRQADKSRTPPVTS